MQWQEVNNSMTFGAFLLIFVHPLNIVLVDGHLVRSHKQ
jgi:hypothetical protein